MIIINIFIVVRSVICLSFSDNQFIFKSTKLSSKTATRESSRLEEENQIFAFIYRFEKKQ
jgi:hypothetical protein